MPCSYVHLGLEERRRLASCKLVRHAERRAAVVDQLRAGWSPEQIAGRLRIEPRVPHRLCHETIYRFVHGPTGQSEELARHLPQRRRRRRTRFARKPRSPVLPDHGAIRHRAEAVGRRTELGNWECDLMILRKERHSLFRSALGERGPRMARRPLTPCSCVRLSLEARRRLRRLREAKTPVAGIAAGSRPPWAGIDPRCTARVARPPLGR